MTKEYLSTGEAVIAALMVICVVTSGAAGAQQHLGKFLGKLSELNHGVSGEVYAVDARTLHIKDFTYDGQGPAAYFFASNGRTPGNTGFRIRDENGKPEVLRRYRKESVTITLPDGKTLNSIKWFYVWCEEFEVNFGDVKIPRNFDYPRPQKIDGLRGIHGVASDNIVIVDAQTLLVPNLSYDGEAPDAKFWVGRGAKPTPQGIRVPDENGKEVPLRRYDRKTVVLTLPGDLTVFDIGHFGIWCEAFTVDFGHVQIPTQQLNVPPSLKMLGVSPQKSAQPQNNVAGGAGTTNYQQRPRPQQPQQRIEATTYRPTFNFNQHAASRRVDSVLPQNQHEHEVVNRDIYSRSYTQNLVSPGFVNQQLQQHPNEQYQKFAHAPQQFSKYAGAAANQPVFPPPRPFHQPPNNQFDYIQQQPTQQNYLYNQAPQGFAQHNPQQYYQQQGFVPQLQPPSPFQQQTGYNQLVPGGYEQHKFAHAQQRQDQQFAQTRQYVPYTPFSQPPQQQQQQQQQYYNNNSNEQARSFNQHFLLNNKELSYNAHSTNRYNF